VEDNIAKIPVSVKNETDTPVDGALVMFKNADGVTRQVTVGNDGKGFINNVSVGEWEVTVTATGYDTLTETVNIVNDDELVFKLTES
jgi:DNA/RNA endonuclease YhcR with UshA esterase domain